MIPAQFLNYISSIPPHVLTSYLVNNDWMETILEKNLSVWHRNENESLELLQPKAAEFRDYNERIYELILKLSEFEERSEELVFSDLSNFNCDLVKVRVAHEDVGNGSIPLDDGVLLFEKARELIISVVRSTFSKRKYFSGGKLSEEVLNFLNTIRFGQTERGSYIVNLIAPIILTDDDQQDIHKISLTRSITSTLANSLTALEESIKEYKETNRITAFDRAVEKGASANLCDALAGLSGENKKRNVDIKISLSKSELGQGEIKLLHIFDSSCIPYLERASEYYKDNYVIPNITITGIVTKLTHEPDSNLGVITIDATVNEKQKNVSVELSMEDYWSAHNAHKEKRPIEISGDLHVSPKSARLINNRSFRVFGNNDLFSDE